MKKDKLYHFIAGILIALVFSIITPFTGLMMAILIGAGKELVWDFYLKKGSTEFLDWIYTVVGGLIVYIILQRLTVVV